MRLLAFGLLTTLAIAACQQQTSQTSEATATASNPEDCRIIQHEMGETEVCGEPERIVVLGPYILEYLLALDVQPIGYADHVAFHQGDYTNPSQQIPYLGDRITPPIANVGTAFSPSLEAILKLQPDLIVGVADNNTDQYETLAGIAPTLLLDYFDPAESLRAIAQAINQPEQVEQLIEQRQQQLALAQEDFAPLVAAHPKVLLLSSSELQDVRLESPAGYCSSLLEELGFQRVSPPGVDADSITAVPISLETLSYAQKWCMSQGEKKGVSCWINKKRPDEDTP